MPLGFTKYLGRNYNLYRQPASANEGVTGGQRGANNYVCMYCACQPMFTVLIYIFCNRKQSLGIVRYREGAS